MSKANAYNINFANYSVAILAGGKGTRIQAIDNTVPKPLIKIADKPVLSYQLDFFIQNNIKKIFILAGYKGDIIDYYIQNNYPNQDIEVIVEPAPLDTAGCLFYIKEKITTPYLILISGDLIFDIDLTKLCQFHEEKKAVCTLTVHSNSHPLDADLVVYDKTLRSVEDILLRPHPIDLIYSNSVNAAISILDTQSLTALAKGKPCNFEQGFVKRLLSENHPVFAYHTFEYIYDMGTPERYFQVEKDVLNRVPVQRRSKQTKSAILLDIKMLLPLLYPSRANTLKNFTCIVKWLNTSGKLLFGFYDSSTLHKDILKIETALGNALGSKFDSINLIEHYAIKPFSNFLEGINIDVLNSDILGPPELSETMNFKRIFKSSDDFISYYHSQMELK